jgi:hypothetical protein
VITKLGKDVQQGKVMIRRGRGQQRVGPQSLVVDQRQEVGAGEMIAH